MIIAFPLFLALLGYALYVRAQHGSRFNHMEKFVNGALTIVGATGTAICLMVWTTLWAYGLKPLLAPIGGVVSDVAYAQTTVLGILLIIGLIALVAAVFNWAFRTHRRNSAMSELVPASRKRRRPSTTTKQAADMHSASLAPRHSGNVHSARMP